MSLLPSVVATVSAGLRGALLLARGHPEGLRLVDHGDTGVARSFWAIPLSLPAIVCLKLLAWVPSGLPANAPLALGRYLLLFLVGWLAFVVISHHLAGLLDRRARWPRLVAVWSYCSVIENTLFALGTLPGALGAPPPLAELCEVVTLGWALWLDWYAIRLALDVSALAAGALLAVDVGIGLAMGVLVATL